MRFRAASVPPSKDPLTEVVEYLHRRRKWIASLPLRDTQRLDEIDGLLSRITQHTMGDTPLSEWHPNS